VLSADYFTVPEEEIKGIEAVLTIMGGKVVHGAEEFGNLAPPLPPISPDWSPIGVYGGAHRQARGSHAGSLSISACAGNNPLHQHTHTVIGDKDTWGIGCTCFAF